ncbi:transposase [Streptomyces sp. NPDC003635]
MLLLGPTPPKHWMLDAVFYLVDNGIKWRVTPAVFPARDRVYAFFRRWRDGALSPSCTTVSAAGTGNGPGGAAGVAAVPDAAPCSDAPVPFAGHCQRRGLGCCGTYTWPRRGRTLAWPS